MGYIVISSQAARVVEGKLWIFLPTVVEIVRGKCKPEPDMLWKE